MNIYESVFNEISQAYQRENIHPSLFTNMENIWFCQKLRLLTFDPHEPSDIDISESPLKTIIIPKMCCMPVLVRCLKEYKFSGWFPNKDKKYPYLYIYMNGQWHRWDK